MAPRVVQAGRERSYGRAQEPEGDCWLTAVLEGHLRLKYMGFSVTVSSGLDSVKAEWAMTEGTVKTWMDGCQKWKKGTSHPSTQPSSLQHPAQSEPPCLMLPDSKDLRFTCT